MDILAETDEAKEALVVVPNDQLSLAIGREGQNVRLAHKLTGWKIDIKSEAQMEAIEQDLYKESLENGELDGDDDTDDEISQEIEEEMNESYVVDEAEIENNGDLGETDENSEVVDDEI